MMIKMSKQQRFILKLTHTYIGVVLTIIKVFIILFLLGLWKLGIPWQLSKQISWLFFQMSVRYILFLAKLKGKGRPFFRGCKKGGAHQEITPKSTWLLQKMKKVSPFAKFEIIPPLLCCLLDPPYK